MSDFSIKSRDFYQQSESENIQNQSEYSKMKSEYKEFQEKSKKSDFYNSPVYLDKQLEMLEKLEALAIKDGLEDELESIQKEKESLTQAAKQNSEKQDLPGNNYYMPVNIQPQRQESTHTIEEVESLFEDKEKVNLENLIKYCYTTKGITNNNFQAISILASVKTSPQTILQIIDKISSNNKNEKDVNTQTFKHLADLKRKGCNDEELLIFSKLLNRDFEDTELIKNSILRMKKADISAETIVKLIEILSVNNEETKQESINENDVNAIISIKRNLALTRNNERNERNNPINQLGVVKFDMSENNRVIMKNNEIIYVSPTEGESFHSATEEYNKLIKEAEENLIIDLVKEFKSQNREITPNHIRTIAVLRKNGITYPQIQEMLNYCIDDDGKINTNKLAVISQLKKSGALGTDIITILNACRINDDKTFNPDDIQTACDLTSAIIGGNEVVTLLQDVKNNPEAKEFFINFSPFFQDKSNLLRLKELIKDENSKIDNNKMDIIYNLEQNLFEREGYTINETEFLKISEEIISEAQNEGEYTVSDDAAGICAIMCRNRMSIEDIKHGLQICKDNNGNIDEDLAEILWDLCLNDADINEITQTISQCKDEYNNINKEYVKSILNKF